VHGTRHWITLAANFVVVVSEANAGAVIERSSQADEYMALLMPGVAATLEATGERIEASGDTFAILPPGDSRITVKSPGFFARCGTAPNAGTIVRER